MSDNITADTAALIVYSIDCLGGEASTGSIIAALSNILSEAVDPELSARGVRKFCEFMLLISVGPAGLIFY
jgi:hypothetical protein